VEPDIAGVSFTVREVPPDYAPAGDETLGTTIGLLATRCYLYEFIRTLGGTAVTDRYTSFESDLTYGGHTYNSRKLSHGAMSQGVALDKDGVDIDTYVSENPALAAMIALRMEAALFVTIIQAEVDAGAAVNAVTVFYGEVVSTGIKGAKLTAKTVTGGSVYDRMIPRVVFQQRCNNSLFDAGCTLVKADWMWTAVVQTPGAGGFPFEIVLNTLTDPSGYSGPAVLSSFFMLGWIEFGSGASWQARAIMANTAPAAGVITLSLDRDPYPQPIAGDAVSIFPGCDLAAATCQSKFSNYLNFLGHPFMPAANPSMVQQNQTGSGGKK
jgi:uncharacterized phage protein (TIGR02218 family)